MRRPDVLIVEGLNVLQAPEVHPVRGTGLAVSDFFDFSVYVDGWVDDIRKWYVQRFLRLRETAFSDPNSYFHRYAALSDAEAVATAEQDLARDQRPQPRAEHPAHPLSGHAGAVQGREPRGQAGPPEEDLTGMPLGSLRRPASAPPGARESR